ncbi:MAG: hypothetical protein WAQ52_19100 [Terriglobales bacterium]
MTRWMLVVLLTSLAVPGVADDSGKRVYSESFKKGATRITEQTLDVTLTPEHAKQDFKIPDSFGKPRYTLRFVPDIPPGDTKILGWFVRLADAHHRIYDSVLPVSPDLAQDPQQVWWLDGRQYSKTPLQAQRVFKVEQFYCVVQVKDVKRLVPAQPYLNQLNVTVQFTNTEP